MEKLFLTLINMLAKPAIKIVVISLSLISMSSCLLNTANIKPSPDEYSNLIDTPLCSEKTYQNTSLENTSPSEFEVLKNFDILETNNIVSVKGKIDDYNNQPTFLPGKFN